MPEEKKEGAARCEETVMPTVSTRRKACSAFSFPRCKER